MIEVLSCIKDSFGTTRSEPGDYQALSRHEKYSVESVFTVNSTHKNFMEKQEDLRRGRMSMEKYCNG